MSGMPSTEEREKEKKKKKKSKSEKTRRKSDGADAAPSATDPSLPETDHIQASSSASSRVVLKRAAEDSTSPILVSFANLTLPPDMKSLKFEVLGGEAEDTKNQRVVMGEGTRMDYWGLNFGPGCESQDLCRFLVGVEDETTGEVTLHEVGHAYALRQSVAGREDMVEDDASAGQDWKQRRDALVNQFGSKKKKATIRARDANVIKADKVVGGGALSRVLKQALNDEGAEGESAGPTDGAAGALMEARKRFLPPMRLDASTPEGVYSAGAIAGGQEMETMGRQIDRAAEDLEGGLQQWVKEFAERPKNACPAFVARRLTLLLDVSEPNQRYRMLQLLYLRHMIAFHHSGNLLKGTPGQLSTNLDIPEVVVRRLLEKFAVCESRGRGGAGSYSRTKTLKNQLLVHTLCLALVLEGCRLEFETLSQDLKLSTADTRAMIRELGCTATKSMAQLKLPLVFPRSRKGRAN